MANGQILQPVTFRLGEEELGIDMRRVQEINRRRNN
jgi:chemotaxis signal transduction protein